MTMPSNGAGQPPVGATSAFKFRRLWRDHDRLEQRARIGALHLQTCEREGQAVYEEVKRVHSELPQGTRIDLPSARVFGAILGLFRSVALLKYRPINELQLAVKDIAIATGYSKSVVEAALRWMGSDPIFYRGQKVARGLGYISRVRRKGKALVDGVLRGVYRTSETALTVIGQALLGIAAALEKMSRATASRSVADEAKAQRAAAKSSSKSERKKTNAGRREAEPEYRWEVGLAVAREVSLRLEPPRPKPVVT